MVVCSPSSKVMLSGVKLGFGSDQYELITME